MKLEQLTYRDCLYGPKRTTLDQKTKNILTKDNIKIHFDNESVGAQPSKTTHTSEFGKKDVSTECHEKAKLNAQFHVKPNICFGDIDNKRSMTTTTCFEYPDKGVLPQVKIHDRDTMNTTNIPVFCLQHLKSQKVAEEGSIYGTSYNTALKHPKCDSKTHLKDRTNDMRSTHFNFGSVSARNITETCQSYHLRKHNRSAKRHVPVIATSCVFRAGDWDVTSTCTPQQSVSHDNYPDRTTTITSALPKIKTDIAPRTDLRLLGSDSTQTSSLCKSDFFKYDMSDRPLKPIQVGRPKSSKLFEPIQDCMLRNAERKTDFIPYSKDVQHYLEERAKNFSINKKSQKKSSIVLTNKEGEDEHTKILSLTTKDYSKPPKEIVQQERSNRNIPVYDYIGLGVVEETENKVKRRIRHKFSPSLRCKNSLDCLKRSKECQGTHFQFGSDKPPSRSEKFDQFTYKVPVSSNYPAAGKKTRDTACNDLLMLTSGNITNTDKQEYSSVMKSDYIPLAERRETSAQRRLSTLNMKANIAPTHYFHLATKDGPTKSTTATDYISPESMSCYPTTLVK